MKELEAEMKERQAARTTAHKAREMARRMANEEAAEVCRRQGEPDPTKGAE